MDLINIFVSYSHEDDIFAQRFSKTLASVGIKHFIDYRIKFGDDFVKMIDIAIRQASHFVCLVSQASIHSPWVYEEMSLAKKYAVKVVPILLEPDVHLEPTLDSNIQYIQIYDHDLSDDDLFGRLIKAGMFDDGIVPAKLFRRYEKRFPTEFFASELLTQPLFLSLDEEKIVVRVNRSEVKYVVISNTGKKKLCERFVTPNRSKLIELDNRILTFMRDPREQRSLEIQTAELPLRWASGGVLSIVNHDNRKWVPLFFRDIPPYGWNVSLGATERYFNDQGYLTDEQEYSLEYELTYPWKFIVREFLEETLVLRNQPRAGGNCEWRRFDFPPNVQIKVERNQAERFVKHHLDLRRNQDGLNIRLHPQGLRIVICDDTTSDLSVVGNNPQEPSPGVWDVLVAINPLELGIEVIKVFEYALPPDHCMLDGEVYQIGGHRQMVRMPIGLISLEYLYRNFGACDYQLQFNEQDVQPSVNAAPFGLDDIRVFKWDYDQRERIWGGALANEWERERFSEWQEHFDAQFTDGLNGNIAAYPSLFTPATVKALNLYFNCCQRGQSIASEYGSKT